MSSRMSMIRKSESPILRIVATIFLSLVAASSWADPPYCDETTGSGTGGGPGGPPGPCSGLGMFSDYHAELKGVKGIVVDGVPSGCCPSVTGLIPDPFFKNKCSVSGSSYSCNGINFEQWYKFDSGNPAKSCVKLAGTPGSAGGAIVSPAPGPTTPIDPGPVYQLATQGGANNTIKTQIFQVFDPVPQGAIYYVGIYSVTVEVVAGPNETINSIAMKLVNAVNAYTEAQWMAVYSTFDPPVDMRGQVGFKPSAQLAMGSSGKFMLDCDPQHSFSVGVRRGN